MRVALAVSGDDLATVADFAQNLWLVEVGDGLAAAPVVEALVQEAPAVRAERLRAAGVGILIAGAVSDDLAAALAVAGIRLLGPCAGPAIAVLDAFVRGRLERTCFRLPDCGRRRHRHGAGRCRRAAGASAPPSSPPAPERTAMTIVITSQGRTLADPIDPRFGRALRYLAVDPDSDAITVHDNPFVEAGHGAGIRAAELVAGLGPSAVLSGEVGPKALAVLKAAGIAVYAAPAGSAAAALAAWRAGTLRRLDG